jgi:hypothetical protein
MKNIVLFALIMTATTSFSQGFEKGTRFWNSGLLLYNGSAFTGARTQINLFLPQPTDEPRICVMQDTQVGTISVLVQNANGEWLFASESLGGQNPEFKDVSTGDGYKKYQIIWGGIVSKTVKFTYN